MPLSHDRVANLADRIGAPATREEEQAMARELRDLRRVYRAALKVVHAWGTGYPVGPEHGEGLELVSMLEMAAETTLAVGEGMPGRKDGR